MRFVAADGCTPTPLFLHKRSPSGDVILTLQVDHALWWAFKVVKVVRAPDSTLVGKQFAHVSDAMGALQKCLGESGGALRYLEQLEACVLGEIEESHLGEEFVHSDGLAGEGEMMVQRHSPRLSAHAVQSLQEPAVGGRWLTAALLRPFVPHVLSQNEAQEQIADMMRKGLHIPKGKHRHHGRPERVGRAAPGALAPSAVPPGDFTSMKEMRDRGDGPLGGLPVVGRAAKWELPVGKAPEPPPVSAPPRGAKRKRQDKEGHVVFLKDPSGMVWPPCAMVVGGKEMRVPPRPGASPRYVQVTPLRGPAPKPEWRHIEETEPLQDAGPRLFKLYEERKDLPLLRVLLEAAASGTARVETVWSQMAPNMSPAEMRALAALVAESESGGSQPSCGASAAQRPE